MSAMDRSTLFTDPAELHRPDAGVFAETEDAETLPQLIHGAAWARRFLQMHRHAARQCLRAARLAALNGNRSLSARLLREAKDEHAQARNCTRFAMGCEARADAMAVAAGVHRATGRNGRFSPQGAIR